MASAELSGRFAPKAKIGVWLRASDVFAPSTKPLSTATVDQNGDLTVKGLDVGVQYWVTEVDPPRSHVISVQGKDASFNEDATLHRVGPEATGRRLQADREAQAEARAKAEKSDPLVASPASTQTVVDNTPKRKTPSVAEPQPGPRQDEISGPQRSDTPDGEATPKDPNESVPHVRQEDVAKGALQRSDTATGIATVKAADEILPSARQEDVPTSTPQRSNTETGQAEPKPPVRGAEVKKRDDSSANRARGRTKVKAEENVKPKGPVKQTTRTGTAKRSSRKR
jgi:hypothetical protein